MITAQISRTGGKFRLRKTLLDNTPKHDYFLSLFLGSGIYELNKPRCKFECFNDVDSELVNYFLVIKNHPEEFEQMKKGVFGLVSQEIFNRILSGQLKPRNNIEKAYFFYYITKLSFGGMSRDYRGVFTRAGTPSGYLGIGVKTTSPFTNNDNGLLTPLEPEAIERLRYVNITSYPFERVYKNFEKALLKKEITETVFIYADPPFPSGEFKLSDEYPDIFTIKDHQKLIKIFQNTRFRIMLSIGGDCEFYLEELSEFNIQEVYTKYSTDANSQKLSLEYLIMNHDINDLPKMKEDYKQKTLFQFQEVD